MPTHATACHEARAELIRSGMGADLMAAATPPGTIHGAGAAQQHAHLCQIAAYIDSDDPKQIVAAFLLEVSGHDRAQMSFGF